MTVFTHYTPRTGLQVIDREKALGLFTDFAHLEDVVILAARGSRSWFNGSEFLCAMSVGHVIERPALVVKRLKNVQAA